jgi:deoxyribodipyrimidine photolyase-related protein
MRNNNYLNHNNKINNNIYKKLWTATTNILPIDNIIQKIIRISYAHHIERLMYIGNFLLLCKIRPKDVYRMFMEWTIDAYDWVMVPNVFGMSTYSDGGMMMTRPYFSSSKYILRMSNYKKDKWCEIWDILYYNFIYSHQDILRKNYATAMQVKHWDNKKPNEKKDIIKKAQHFIENWDFV